MNAPELCAASGPIPAIERLEAQMAEQGIDLGHAFTKTVDDVPRDRVRTVIMLCAEEVCPVFPGDVEKLHWPFEDPAAATGSDEDRLASFRRVRDQIHERLQRHFSER